MDGSRRGFDTTADHDLSAKKGIRIPLETALITDMEGNLDVTRSNFSLTQLIMTDLLFTFEIQSAAKFSGGNVFLTLLIFYQFGRSTIRTTGYGHVERGLSSVLRPSDDLADDVTNLTLFWPSSDEICRVWTSRIAGSTLHN